MSNMIFNRKLPIPKDVKTMYPVSDEMAAVKGKLDDEIKAVFSGASSKFLLIIGPCSADHRESVLDYIGRLRKVQDRVTDKILIIPRIYTNKPRSTGDGYMGMLHQPDPVAAPDILNGLIAIRDLHLTVLRDYGFSCADELLYPENYRYLSDLLAYVSVGARSVENQQHRLVASGIDVPVGMKNPTGGDLSVMMNGIKAAQNRHVFLYRGWEVESCGNPYAHAILRGYADHDGRYVANYSMDDLLRLSDAYEQFNLLHPAAIVDCNHANSGKQPLEQVRIAKEVVQSCNHSADVKRLVKGLMIESYIEDGAQTAGENIYGKSITDPCLGWDKTERLILDLAESL